MRACAISPRMLRMSLAELESVATFYNLIFRRPVGRHVIMVCDSVSCWIMGHDQHARSISKHAWVSDWARQPPTIVSRCCRSFVWAAAITRRP